MVSVKSSGSFAKTLHFLNTVRKGSIFYDLDQYGKQGVLLLSQATPKDSGKTASMWDYEITRQNGRYKITWINKNDNEGVNVAVLIQYGHGTGTGGYVEGIDYINPALRPLFDKMADDIWKRVTNA